MATKKITNASPKSRVEFIRLMQDYAGLVITWQMARDADACEDGLKAFQTAYFPRRRRLTLGELIPFVRHDSVYWFDVCSVINRVLAGRGILCDDYWYGMQFYSPATELPRRYLADQKRYPQPTTNDALARLVSKHGKRTISRQELDSYGLSDFCERAFPKRKRLRLKELAPYVRCQHLRWYDVTKAVQATLRNRGILAPDYSFTRHMGSPYVLLPRRYRLT